MKNRIRELREKLGLSQQWLAEKAHTSQPQIDRLEKGERKLTQEWMKRLAPHLGVQPADLMLKEEQSEGLKQADVSGVKVRGFVQAGYWREAGELPEDDWYSVAMPTRDPRYPGMDLFGLEVRGASMNKVFPEGTVLACIHLMQHPLAIGDGKYVVVERQNGHGDVEATVKQVQRDAEGKVWLWPRSDDPEHQSPIKISDGEEVRIVALVVRSSIPV